MRIALPPPLAQFIAARIVNFATEAPPERQWLAPYVARHAALPLYLGWTESIGIRTTGELVQWNTEGEHDDLHPVDERPWGIFALLTGAKTHLELQQLVPTRPADARDCNCRPLPPQYANCLRCAQCGGLGWLPAPH